MYLHLEFVGVLCALLSPVCFSSITGFNRKFDNNNDEIVRIKAFDYVHSPTNFSTLPASSSVTITAPTTPHVPKNVQGPSTFPISDFSTSESSSSSTRGVSTSESSSSVSVSTRGVVLPTMVSSESSTVSPAVATTTTANVLPIRPTATISPHGTPTPSVPPTSPHSLPSSNSRHSQPTHSIASTGCAPPITVTINNGAYCTNTPSPPQPCSSDCTSKIGLSLGISIPATAIITFLVTSLSCLFCQRVKKKQSYIQLAPTVYFDEEEHD